MNAFIRTFLCEFSFTFPFGLLLLTLGPSYKLKGLYVPILFLVLFCLFLLQFPGCIAQIQVYVISLGRNYFGKQFSIIYSKGHENVYYFGPVIGLLKMYPKEINFQKIGFYDFYFWP